MFIKSLRADYFKGFGNQNNYIEFKIPDGINLGSGLNIFIGENNSGKSTILEAIDFLRNATKKELIQIRNKNLDGECLNHASVELEFLGNIKKVIEEFSQPNKKPVFNKKVYECGNRVEHLRLKRTTEDSKIIWLWQDDEKKFENVSGLDSPLKRLFETNFIWADTNPNDEASFGTTTICGMLLSEIVKTHKETDEYKSFSDKFHEIFNSEHSNLRQSLSEIEEQLNEIIKNQFGEASIKFKFEELKIESYFKNSSILIDDGIEVPMNEKGNGMQRSVALALLQVYASIIAYDEEQGVSKPFYLFIDEPEICLHPKGQQKLFEALLKISKYRQVFVSTHSPYFLANQYLKNMGLFIFKKSNFYNQVQSAELDYMFPWSPTWGELNFKAYDLATVDFHNELYGYLQELSKNRTEKDFESWLFLENISKTKKWAKEIKGVAQPENDVTLMTFIRNHIHHPENIVMQSNKYNEVELENSIKIMIELINKYKNN